VTFGWYEADTTPATAASGTCDTFEPLMLESPDAFPVNIFAFKIPETVRFVNVPTLVMFGWDAKVTLRAVGAGPEREFGFKLRSPDPSPENVPPMTEPVTVKFTSVPRPVMFDCVGFVTEPATYADPTVPVMLVPGTFVSPLPEPEKVPALAVPETLKDERVPTLVMFGCAGFVTEAATYADPTVPVTFEAFSADKALPDPEKVPALAIPETLRDERVPTLVMFGWAGLVTEAATYADPTVPVILDPGTFVRPLPEPENVPALAVPETVKDERVPTLVMFG